MVRDMKRHKSILNLEASNSSWRREDVVLLPSMASLWGQILNRLLGMCVHHWHIVRHLDQLMPAQALQITVVSIPKLRRVGRNWKNHEEPFTWSYLPVCSLGWNKWHHDIVGGIHWSYIYTLESLEVQRHVWSKSKFYAFSIFQFPCTGHMDNFC